MKVSWYSKAQRGQLLLFIDFVWICLQHHCCLRGRLSQCDVPVTSSTPATFWISYQGLEKKIIQQTSRMTNNNRRVGSQWLTNIKTKHSNLTFIVQRITAWLYFLMFLIIVPSSVQGFKMSVLLVVTLTDICHFGFWLISHQVTGEQQSFQHSYVKPFFFFVLRCLYTTVSMLDKTTFKGN